MLGVGLGCSTDVLLCNDDDECGADGVCEATGYCSSPDESCPSGRRYNGVAGDGLAYSCVQEPPSVVEGSGTTTPDPTTSSTTATTGPDPDGSGTTTSVTTLDSGESTVGVADTSDTTTDTTGPTSDRVTEGLLVLYLFDEGEGTTVADVSEVSPPLHLTIEGDDFSWAASGLLLDGNSIVRAQSPATKILDGCQATDEITVEAWVTPQAASMLGPGRIVTFSESASLRNFTLGQGQFEVPSNPYIGRLRTSDTSGSNNGVPELDTGLIASPMLVHLIYLRTIDGFDRLYVDGVMEAEGPRTGDFSNWSDVAEFACGNEITLDRPWEGTMHLVAVYDRALTAEDIAQNFAAGP